MIVGRVLYFAIFFFIGEKAPFHWYTVIKITFNQKKTDDNLSYLSAGTMLQNFNSTALSFKLKSVFMVILFSTLLTLRCNFASIPAVISSTSVTAKENVRVILRP